MPAPGNPAFTAASPWADFLPYGGVLKQEPPKGGTPNKQHLPVTAQTFSARMFPRISRQACRLDPGNPTFFVIGGCVAGNADGPDDGPRHIANEDAADHGHKTPLARRRQRRKEHLRLRHTAGKGPPAEAHSQSAPGFAVSDFVTQNTG